MVDERSLAHGSTETLINDEGPSPSMAGAVQRKQAQDAKDAKNEGIDKEHAKVSLEGVAASDTRPTPRPMPSRARVVLVVYASLCLR